jgi:hypothetical protein
VVESFPPFVWAAIALPCYWSHTVPLLAAFSAATLDRSSHLASIYLLVLYAPKLELNHTLRWKMDMWWVLKIVLSGVWGHSHLYPDGKFWRGFHTSEWGTYAKTNADSPVSVFESRRYRLRWNEIIDWTRLPQLRQRPPVRNMNRSTIAGYFVAFLWRENFRAEGSEHCLTLESTSYAVPIRRRCSIPTHFRQPRRRGPRKTRR